MGWRFEKQDIKFLICLTTGVVIPIIHNRKRIKQTARIVKHMNDQPIMYETKSIRREEEQTIMANNTKKNNNNIEKKDNKLISFHIYTQAQDIILKGSHFKYITKNNRDILVIMNNVSEVGQFYIDNICGWSKE